MTTEASSTPSPAGAPTGNPSGQKSDRNRRRNNRRRRDNRNRNRDNRPKKEGQQPAPKPPEPAREGGRNRDRDRQRRGGAKAKKFTGRISDHFSQKDFVCHCGECNQKVRVSLGLVGILEYLRSQVRKRINIVKGYQCQKSHDKTGSFYKNYHISGIAADIQVEDLTPQEVFLEAEKIPELKGIGLNLDLNLIHIDTRKDAERSEWVVQRGKRIPLDSTNRVQFITE